MQITWESRDRFTVSVSEPPALAAARQQAAAEAALEPPPALQAPPLRIIYDGKEQQQQRRQGQGPPPAGPEASGSPSSNGSNESNGSSRRVPDGSIDVDITSEESESEEISVLLSAAAAQQQQQQDVHQQQQAAEQDAVAADSAELAAQIEAVRSDMEAGKKPSKEQLSEIGAHCCFGWSWCVPGCPHMAGSELPMHPCGFTPPLPLPSPPLPRPLTSPYSAARHGPGHRPRHLLSQRRRCGGSRAVGAGRPHHV